MSIASRISEMNDHLLDDYSVLELAGADLTDVDKNIVNLKPTWKERLLHFMNYGTQEVWDNWEKREATITDGTVNGTEEAPMKLVYKGNAYQYQLKGINKLKYPYDDTTKTVDSLTFTDIGDGTIKINGGPRNYATNFSIYDAYSSNVTISSGTYTFSASGIPSGCTVSFYLRDQYNVVSQSIGLTSSHLSETITINEELKVSGQIIVNSNTTVSNAEIKFMLQTGSTVSDWEPYSGEVPVPNPDYPQDIHTVSGDNSIEVVGKNMFDTTKVVGTYISENNGVITLNSSNGYNITGENVFLKDICPNLKIGETYTLSFNNTDNTTNHYNDIFLRTTNAYWTNGTSRTITQNDLDGRIAFYGVNAQVSNVQIEKGNQATTYEPYQSQSYPISLGDIELCKIGTYQDKIDKSTGKNLLDLGTSNSDYVSTNGQTSTIVNSVSNNSISMNIAGSGGTYFYRNQKLSGNNTFTISFKAPSRYFRLYVRIRNTDDTNWLTSSDFTPSESGWTYNSYYGGWYYEFITASSSSIYEKTITIPNCSYWLIGFGANTALGEGTVQTISNIQVEKGNQATSYEPYGTDWYLKKEIGKVVYSGEWFYNSSADIFLCDNSSISGKYLVQNAFCNYYKNIVNSNITNNANAGSRLNNGEFSFRVGTMDRIYIKDTRYTTTEDFNTWLSTHNISVYYVLATPTYETITDTTLLSQLEEAKKSYESQTNISQENNDLPFVLEVVALSDGTSQIFSVPLLGSMSTQEEPETLEEVLDEPIEESEEETA